MNKSSTIEFILQHDSQDTSILLFGASKYPEVDMQFAVRAIEARKKIKVKIPLWHHFPDLDYPAMINVEQCSSQATALYKQRFVIASEAPTVIASPNPAVIASEAKQSPTTPAVADLTGGLGVDTYFLSLVSKEVDYFERNATLAEAAKGNFAILRAQNINVSNCDSRVALTNCSKKYDLIYIDPARRGNMGQRVYSIADCEPDVMEMEELIFTHSDRVLIKASPMADIRHTLELFPKCSQIHIVSVENECKEVLILLEKEFAGEAEVYAVNIHDNGAAGSSSVRSDCHTDGGEEHHDTFRFHLKDEANAAATLTSTPKRYIYQPNKSLLKAGCFKIVCGRYGVEKLAPSTHLYTSDEIMREFPGRRYEVIEVLPFNKQSIKEISARYPNAEVEALNFPLSTNALKEKLKLKSSSDKIKHFACTLSDTSKVIIVVRR